MRRPFTVKSRLKLTDSISGFGVFGTRITVKSRLKDNLGLRKNVSTSVGTEKKKEKKNYHKTYNTTD